MRRCTVLCMSAHPVGPQRPPILIVALQPDHGHRVVLVVRDHDVVRPRPPYVVRLGGGPHVPTTGWQRRLAAGGSRSGRSSTGLGPATKPWSGSTRSGSGSRQFQVRRVFIKACRVRALSTSLMQQSPLLVRSCKPGRCTSGEGMTGAGAAPRPPPRCRCRGRLCPAPSPRRPRPAPISNMRGQLLIMVVNRLRQQQGICCCWPQQVLSLRAEHAALDKPAATRKQRDARAWRKCHA
jgi:hypothetical protein